MRKSSFPAVGDFDKFFSKGWKLLHSVVDVDQEGVEFRLLPELKRRKMARLSRIPCPTGKLCVTIFEKKGLGQKKCCVLSHAPFLTPPALTLNKDD